MTEPQLKEFFGPAIFKFVHEFYGRPQQKGARLVENPHDMQGGRVMILELSLKRPIGEGKANSLSLVRGKMEAAAGSTTPSISQSTLRLVTSRSRLRFLPCCAQPSPVAARNSCYSGALLIFIAAGLRKAKAGTEFLIRSDKPWSRPATGTSYLRGIAKTG
ncbi:hypothetical protein [Bradyrhizobium sp. JYMT SZCCT0428]|uniref:hypothetical protein n=1 Tax=Bradyrhizobium sp. JYMT SZCCT0428 TaxID=2807673 RepID=UPI001BA652B6|nr:hypothetical protein [Bradyrhizobium sp. JYMT SZCCT0428]MBR1155798.1 hypothetical protein [Bradyrhizobium sp. JYMT SZCCT0428]